MIVCMSGCTSSHPVTKFSVKHKTKADSFKIINFIESPTRMLLNSRHFKYHETELVYYRVWFLSFENNKNEIACMCTFHVSRMAHIAKAGGGVVGCEASFLIAWVHHTEVTVVIIKTWSFSKTALLKMLNWRVFNCVDGVWTALKSSKRKQWKM